MQRLAAAKQKIKNDNVTTAALKEATRVIESSSKRIVHFMFDPKQKVKQSPFTKKLNLFLSGELETAEQEEHEKFDAYIEKFVEDTLEDGDHNPVTFEDNEYPELELNSINHISFAVANNPFFKVDPVKYYPQVIVINKEGKILAQYGESECNEDAEKMFPSMKDRTNFRDDKIRINDDYKIEMKLDEFKDPSIQVILTCRTYDLRKEKDIPDNTHNDAWFRLQNEQTSQTLDYTKLKKLESKIPEGYEEGEVQDEVPEDEERKIRNELIYLAGRVYCEPCKKTGTNKWIFEKWNQVVASEKYP